MNVEIGTEAPIFLFWEFLFQIFGILSLQCTVQKVTREVNKDFYGIFTIINNMFAISIIIKGGTLLTMTQYQKYVFLQYRLSRDYKTQISLWRRERGR